jgi:hypothetical protein
MSNGDHRGRNAGATGILLLIVVGMIFYVLYTDEIQGTISATQTTAQVGGVIKGFTDLLPLSLANVPSEGEIICDLDLHIPTLLSNRAFFGTPKSDVISDDMGNKLSDIGDFLDVPEWLYIQTDNIAPPNWEWKNCYNEGRGSFSSLTPFIPLFNGQLAAEKLDILSLADRNREIPQDPRVASQLPFVTDASFLNMKISAKNDEDLFLIDKFNNAVFQRIIYVKDNLEYPVLQDVRFTIENTKLDDYNISITAKKPINEIRIGDPYVLRLCGLNQDLTPKLEC